jgi:hypothetical protein
MKVRRSKTSKAEATRWLDRQEKDDTGMEAPTYEKAASTIVPAASGWAVALFNADPVDPADNDQFFSEHPVVAWEVEVHPSGMHRVTPVCPDIQHGVVGLPETMIRWAVRRPDGKYVVAPDKNYYYCPGEVVSAAEAIDLIKARLSEIELKRVEIFEQWQRRQLSEADKAAKVA